MHAVVNNPELFSLWVKLGLLAIETWAAKHDDEFYVSDRQLMVLTSRKRPDAAHKMMRKLVSCCPILARYHDDTGLVSDRYGDGIWTVKFTNLLEKQGFERKNSQRTDPPYKTSNLLPKKGADKPVAKEPDESVVEQAKSLFIN